MTADPTLRVDVVWARPGDLLGDGPDRDAAAVALLDDVERSRLARLRRPADRDRFAAAHALLRLAVGRFAGVDPAQVVVSSTCPDCGAPHGRPMITLNGRPGPHVSLSHAGDRVVVAVTGTGPVGVDVEPLDDAAFTDDAMDDIALTPQEQAAIAGLRLQARADARARLWVRKEALLKATGQGLRVPPSQVAVTDESAPGWRAGHRLADLDLGEGYAACLAVLSPAHPAVELGRWSSTPGHPFVPDGSERAPDSSGSGS